MATPKIKSFEIIHPMIYAYQTPGIPAHNGWTKIGYTEKQSVEDRIDQQTGTADIKWHLCWTDFAMYKDGSGETFTDHDFHAFLQNEHHIPRSKNRKGRDTEWFKISGNESRDLFFDFASRTGYVPQEGATYELRDEQEKAVQETSDYFSDGGTQFLWNAKPRFGKTLAAYDLVCRMGFEKVLIVTNRPAIANSWADDFRKFIGWQKPYFFVTENDALKDSPGVMSREEYLKTTLSHEYSDYGMIAFESLQSLKGALAFGGDVNKLEWMAKTYRDPKDHYNKKHGIKFDLLIVDEAHEGVDTKKTDAAFDNIDRRYTLYLSGTPFKAIAGGKFSDREIFNWSYADEQEAKENWNYPDANPYERLPRMAMFTYQMSQIVQSQVQRGMDLDGDTVEFAFDLNEFFSTNDAGRFVHEDEVKKFLHALTTQEKYPYSTPELRSELKHTLWLLDRVASARAMKRLLENDPVFSEYYVVLAAGDGTMDDDDDRSKEKSYNKVKDAIAKYDKTITLSVGQLTTGVTIPEWSGVMMLSNMKSPSLYMQAAFRAQNPCVYKEEDGQLYRKETSYVFDFDPARTLIIFDQFANDLFPSDVTTDSRKENVGRLLNFFPVIGEDEDGRMVELNAAQILSIPRRIKAKEVVKRGFMSNFLFQNIGAVFSAPSIVTDILQKLNPAQEEGKKKDQKKIEQAQGITLDDDGNVEVPNEIVIGKTQDLFGDGIYETLSSDVQPALDDFSGNTWFENQISPAFEKIRETVKSSVQDNIVAPIADSYDLKKKQVESLQNQVAREIDDTFNSLQNGFYEKAKEAQKIHDLSVKDAETEYQVQAADDDFAREMQTLQNDFMDAVKQATQDIIQDKPEEITRKVEQKRADEEKKSIEDEVRSRLRGFSRTIPSFLMAYGDENLTLQNFDDYTEDDVFLEVTGITEDDFRFLRDGGTYTDENGEEQTFTGHLFDEVVFNDSVQEFLKKKTELADYFDESKEEDIFDYIPPQKTNQIFTPRWVVVKMLDELEEQNPGCFDNPNATFADLYMKSGLYITEIVKRLYKSDAVKAAYPDRNARIRHILTKQVYGMAPTRIIYLIATNYILGFDESLKVETTNFVQADAAEASKNGTLEKLVNEAFGT